MTNFTIHTLDNAPEAARPILQQLNDVIGFVPNLAATMAGAPLVLEAFRALQTINARTSFSPVERELIAATIAREIVCTYCVAAHSTFAKAFGASEETLAAVRNDTPLKDARLAAFTAFAKQVVHNHGRVSQEDMQAFLNAGGTQTQMLEILVGVSQVMLVNLVHRMASVPLDAGFQPQAWSVQ